jgi:N-acetylmuramoyl-L-alanine amidase
MWVPFPYGENYRKEMICKMKIAIDLGHGVGQDRGVVGVIAEETIINSV